MKNIVFGIFALLACFSLASADVYDSFFNWTIQYGKNYANMNEQITHFNAFKSNYALVHHLNRQSNLCTFELNKFADLTPEEFAAKYLSLMSVEKPSYHTLPYNKGLKYPDSKDWVKDGAVSKVKNQENCGSCWAFSATGAMEGAWFVAHKTLPLISEQQLVDCDKECMNYPGTTQKVCDKGCKGGLMPIAFEYAIKNGMEAEDDYPYKGVDQTCKFDKNKVKYHFSKWFMIKDNEDAIIEAINKYGPLSIGVDATYWSFYSKGIYDSFCSSTKMNHGVLLVGYGVEGNTKYWIVKNSWGTTWGESGYIRLIRGKNKCGINNFVCTIIA